MAPENNPAEDRYNPPGNLSEDFEKFKFSDLEIDEFLVKHIQKVDDVAEEKPEKQLLQEDK